MTRPSPPAIAVAVLAALAGAWWLLGGPSSAPWPAQAVPRGNVLLVTIDTLRADRLDATTMPRLHALARSAHRFKVAYAHAPLTLPSHASILTGLLPPAHGVRGNGAFRLDESHVTLAERLHEAGYRTGAFLGAFVLDARFGLAQGFDHYSGVDDDRAFAADFRFAERRAPAVLSDAERWILEGDSSVPWFAWVHLFDPHAPYDAPASAGLTAYDDEVHYADGTLAAFLDRLGARGAMQRTLLIVTADHGESLGEHGETTHGLFAYDATMRVPLVVSGPRLGAAEHETPAAHIDLVPTILDTLGLPADPALPGQPLRTLGRDAGGRAVYLEAFDGWLAAGAAPVTAVVEQRLKFVDLPEPELYDLAADPGETRNLAAETPDRVPPLADALRGLASARVSGTALDPEAQARLRSLGYAASAPRERPSSFSVDDDPKRVLPLYERFLDLLTHDAHDADALMALVRARPQFEAARLAAASMLIDGGRAAEAVALLEPAAAAPDASRSTLERLGAAHLATGHPDLAVGPLERAVARPHASADAWNSLGAALAEMGQPTRAIEAFDEALRLAPGSARIQFNRVVALLPTGDGAARAEAEAFTRRHPDSADGWRLMATLRHDADDRPGAVNAWERVLALDRSDFDSLYNLAVTLADLGRTDEARRAASRFLQTAPRPQYDREATSLRALVGSGPK